MKLIFSEYEAAFHGNFRRLMVETDYIESAHVLELPGGADRVNIPAASFTFTSGTHKRIVWNRTDTELFKILGGVTEGITEFVD